MLIIAWRSAEAPRSSKTELVDREASAERQIKRRQQDQQQDDNDQKKRRAAGSRALRLGRFVLGFGRGRGAAIADEGFLGNLGTAVATLHHAPCARSA